MVEAVLCGALFLLWNGSGLIPASLNLLDDGFSLINYKGRIGLALGGATVLSLFLDPYGATLVSSQAPTVDNRRTKLLETSVYALIVCPLILDL
ncbi:hypothetical protein HID58_025334 [Brassica napus]|uniref:Uncharacterized protein n=1 Tax=Brassica napus TaxID=3708 RepID=A0ABQ8CKR1_BRANA|nr:hypothetical protein HID58_025334 [Brassica napus]